MRSPHCARYRSRSPALSALFCFWLVLKKKLQIPTPRKLKLQPVRVDEESMLLLHKNKKIKKYKLVTGICIVGNVIAQKWCPAEKVNAMWEQKSFTGSVKNILSRYETQRNSMKCKLLLTKKKCQYSSSFCAVRKKVFPFSPFWLWSHNCSTEHLLWWLSLTHASSSCDL